MERLRSLAPRLLFATSLAAASLAACGDDASHETEPSAGGPSARLGVGEPAARWRRGSDATRAGDGAVVEALRPCRVTFAWRIDAMIEGRETLDLAPGEAVRLTFVGEPSGSPEVIPLPEAERAKGRTRPRAFALRYALDATAERVRTDLVWTKDREPWSSIVAATVPPSWLDLPSGVEFPLLAIGVSDIADAAGLRLDLSTPPRIVSPRPFAPDDLVHVIALVLTIDPR